MRYLKYHLEVEKKQKQQIHSHSLQIIGNRNSTLIKGVSGHGFVEVDGSQTLERDDLIVCSVTGCILDHIELR